MQQNDERIFLACRMNAQLGFDCLKMSFEYHKHLNHSMNCSSSSLTSIIMNYLFNDIISSDRNNPENEKESNNGSQRLYPLFLSICNLFPVERTSDRRQFAMTGTLQ